MNSKRLIINADDLGMSRGITDGILCAHREGVVTSASVMVSEAGSEHAAAQVGEYPNHGVGVHLDICEGAPILPQRPQRSARLERGGPFHFRLG
jgi:hypothetical protein